MPDRTACRNEAKTKRLELELHNVRNTKITSSRHMFIGSPVNWSTWRQFNSHEKNHVYRKEVFDEFIAKTNYIIPIIGNRFSLIKEAYQEYGYIKDAKGENKLNPISGYLENENISYDQFIEFVRSLGERFKKPFREALIDISKKILNREPEYYDDFYFFRNKVYSDIEHYRSKKDTRSYGL